MFLCFLGVFFRRFQILIHFFNVSSLFMYLSVDLVCNLIYVLHRTFDRIQVLLSLLNNFCHVVSLCLYFDLLWIDDDLLLLLAVAISPLDWWFNWGHWAWSTDAHLIKLAHFCLYVNHFLFLSLLEIFRTATESILLFLLCFLGHKMKVWANKDTILKAQSLFSFNGLPDRRRKLGCGSIHRFRTEGYSFLFPNLWSFVQSALSV